MPNTLAHFGGQGILVRFGAPRVDIRWILLGCIIPDIPWIWRRAAGILGLGLPSIDTRLFAMGQASLVGSLMLAGTLAAFSRRPRPVFVVLAVQVMLHLLLDALQTKWGNGVHLFVPLDWSLVNFGLFWPESPVTWVLTALGGAFVLYEWRRRGRRDLVIPPPKRLGVAALLFASWIILPLSWMDDFVDADAHSIKTIQEREARAGRPFAADRTSFDVVPPRIALFGGEWVIATGSVPSEPRRISMTGQFVHPDTIIVYRLHRHAGAARDYASYLALVCLLLFWGVASGGSKSEGKRPES